MTLGSAGLYWAVVHYLLLAQLLVSGQNGGNSMVLVQVPVMLSLSNSTGQCNTRQSNYYWAVGEWVILLGSIIPAVATSTGQCNTGQYHIGRQYYWAVEEWAIAMGTYLGANSTAVHIKSPAKTQLLLFHKDTSISVIRQYTAANNILMGNIEIQ